MLIIADSSALIALAICDALTLLDQLFKEIKVPRAVFEEVTVENKQASAKLRAYLNDKIIELVTRKRITHAQVAQLAGTSRSRVTAILNRNVKDVSTDLLLRVLGSLGYRAEIRFAKAA